MVRRSAVALAWFLVTACGGAIDPTSVDTRSDAASPDRGSKCETDCGWGRQAVAKSDCGADCTSVVACGEKLYCALCAEPPPCAPEEFEVNFCKPGDPDGCRVVDACGVRRYCARTCPNACEPDEQMVTTWTDDCNVPRCRPVEACGRQVYCKEW